MKTKLLSIIFGLFISSASISQTYCTPTFSNSCSSGYISAVVFVDIANGSGCNGNSNNYISYPSSAFTTTVDINSTYNIDINCSTTGGIMGWIDYNQDGDFADAGEYILEDVGVAMYSGAITIPGNALNGQTTMRIIKNGGVVGSSNYCGNFVNGETEDYVITINGVSPTQNAICYSTPDGTGASNWSFKDYVIPSGFKIDSVYMNASRPGYSVQNYDFVFASCQGTTVFTPSLVTYPFSYGSVNTSLYNTWINLTSFSYTAVGMVRVSLPTNAGAIWNNLCFAISPISSNCAQNLSSGLVAKYDFSGNANDVSGNGHNGVVNGATLVADRFGNANKAYDFTNSTDKIVVSNSPSLSLTGNFGFNFWINIRSFNGSFNSIMSKMESGSCNHYGYFMGMMSWNGENKIEFQADPICSNANAYLPNNNGVLLTNQWYNIGITYNQSSSKLKYYKNGVIFDSIIQTLNIQNTTYDLIIGNHVTYPYTINSAGGNFDGTIDDIRIYNRELSPCEMDSLYIPAITTGIAENKSSNVNSLVYPNPASNALFINSKDNEVKSIEILNTVGQSLLYEKIDNSNSKINIENLATGIYLYRIKLSGGSIKTGKFIIER